MKRKTKKPIRKAPARKQGTNPVPPGYHSVTPYLSIHGAAAAIDFYKKAFGAKEVMRMPGPDGKLGHAEIEIGGSRIMLSDEYEAMNFLGPQARGGTSVHIHLYVPNVDAVVKRASGAGATILRGVQDQFYGDRSGSLVDPFGHVWHVATRKENLSAKELKRRAGEAAKQAGSPNA